MPFAVMPIEQRTFASLDDLRRWAGSNKKIVRLPLEGLILGKARFSEDQFFGDASHRFEFNRHAFGALCSILGGLPPAALFHLRESELATRVLNDLLIGGKFRQNALAYDLVVQEEGNVILGLVSKSYQSYPNHQFLDDLELALGRRPGSPVSPVTTGKDMAFHSAYVVNTQVYVRFLSERHVGRIHRGGPEGEDITKIGLQCRNSMVGEASVLWEYFLLRLVCTNGAVVPAGKSQQRVVHAGRCETFRFRLMDRLQSILARIGEVARLVETLAGIPFHPEALASTPGGQMAMEVIPDLRHRIIQRYGRPELPKGSQLDPQIARDAEYLRRIPDVTLGKETTSVFRSARRDTASLFDLVNVFTEFAQGEEPRHRLGIEERAGTLAAWIAENRQKLY